MTSNIIESGDIVLNKRFRFFPFTDSTIQERNALYMLVKKKKNNCAKFREENKQGKEIKWSCQKWLDFR